MHHLYPQCRPRWDWSTEGTVLYMDRDKRIWYLSPMWAAKVQASLRIRAVSPEPLLLAHTSSESRGTLRQKARSLAPLNGWACAVKICHDGMLEDTNSLDGAHILSESFLFSIPSGSFRHITYAKSLMKIPESSTLNQNSQPASCWPNPKTYRKFSKYSDSQNICCNL